jgi:hypothetical protein
MPQEGLKEKTCSDCGKSYLPTSNVQKRCSDCKQNHDSKTKKPTPKTPVITQKKTSNLSDDFRRIMEITGANEFSFISGNYKITIEKNNQ